MVVSAPLLRADPVDDQRGQRTRAIAENLMSPFCPGMTLAACTSPAAREWRADIREWVNQGLGDDEIRSRLEQRAGHDLSGTPRSALGWFLPLTITAGSMALLAWLLYRWRRTDDAKPKAPKPVELDAALDARLEARLERELERGDP
jgi:cytochrome c-type biogenesis protein CcmH/NrfF